VGLAWILVGCGPKVVQPANGVGAVVSVKPASVAGLVAATDWHSGQLTPQLDTNPCPHDKEEFEKALGLQAAEACPIVREKLAPASGDGDAEIPKPIAPHCYEAGSLLIVVRYEEPKTTCTRIVGMAVLPRKQ
jgi:hypothetical protein